MRLLPTKTTVTTQFYPFGFQIEAAGLPWKACNNHPANLKRPPRHKWHPRAFHGALRAFHGPFGESLAKWITDMLVLDAMDQSIL